MKQSINDEIEDIVELLENRDTINLGKELLLKNDILFYVPFTISKDSSQNISVYRNDSNKFLSEFIKHNRVKVYKYTLYYSIYTYFK